MPACVAAADQNGNVYASQQGVQGEALGAALPAAPNTEGPQPAVEQNTSQADTVGANGMQTGVEQGIVQTAVPAAAAGAPAAQEAVASAGPASPATATAAPEQAHTEQ